MWSSSELGCTESDWEGLPAKELFLAVRERKIDVLERLLKGDAALLRQVDSLDGDGFGLLHHIAMARSPSNREAAVQLMDLLLASGASIDLRNKMQETALIIATMYGNLTVAEYLLSNGARADLSDWSGKSALARVERAHASVEDKARLISLLNLAVEQQKKAVGAGGKYIQTAANRLREQGNTAFQSGDYTVAYRLYSDSLRESEDYRTFANRAAVLLKQGVAAYSQQPGGFNMISPDIDRIYTAAITDAGRAATLQPDFAKAWYRQAKAQLGRRDLPRARMVVERGLKACPANPSLQTLLGELFALGVDMEEVRIANPMSGASQAAWAQVQAGAPCITCPYCIQPVPRSGEHDSCPHCAADPSRTDIDQNAIHSLIQKC